MTTRRGPTSPAAHWERVYTERPPERHGWYAPRLEIPPALVERAGIEPDAPLIDVGGGASTLVDDLLDRGFVDLTVLDLSETALALARARLGARAAAVTWIAADVLAAALPRAHYRLWHDRAVFHFLIAPEDRRRYVARMRRALAPGGFVVVGTFAPEAPPRCSGLPVERYDASRLHETLGSDLELVEHRRALHVTPGGVDQAYLYCLFRTA